MTWAYADVAAQNMSSVLLENTLLSCLRLAWAKQCGALLIAMRASNNRTITQRILT